MNSDRVSGLIPIDPSQPVESCRKIDEWVRNGPCIGIKYYGGNPGGVECSHRDNDVIIRDPLGPTTTNEIRPWQYTVSWDRYLAVIAAQGNDAVGVGPAPDKSDGTGGG